MKKFINAMNDEKTGSAIFGALIVVVIGGMMVFSCIRDEAGLVRQPAPVELTECATCSP